MNINIVQHFEKKNHNVFITEDLNSFKEYLNEDEFNYFQNLWEKDNVNFLKLTSGYTIVVKVKSKSKDDIRKSANKVFELLRDFESAILVETKGNFIKPFLEGFLLSSYQFLKYFSEADKKKNIIKSLEVFSNIQQSDIDELMNITSSVFWARDMVNEPASYLSAEKFSEEIQKFFVQTAVNVDVLHQSKIEALKMGGLLAVNKGSIAPATFTILEYKPTNCKNENPIVLVGKGVVYDTGGLNIKTANYMDGMKSDMAGAAAMVATIHALAINNIPIHVIGLIPATDNRPGGEAFASGDIIKMYDGTTVEVLNTDAEGRMILADALAYANKYKPELVIDAATLTGSAVRALGNKVSISMGNAKDFYFKKLYDAGLETNDRVFRFPFWDEWAEEMKSDIADLKNLGGANAGMITAGKFLEHFVKFPYIHLDIAGPAYLESADSYNGKGGTGAGVRLLYQFLKEL